MPTAERRGDREQRNRIRARVEGLALFSRLDLGLRNRAALKVVARDHMHADIAGAPHEIVHHRTMQELEPARAGGLSEHDLGDVVGARIAQHVIGCALVAAAGNGDGLTAERLRQPQRIGDAVALLLAEPSRPAALDKQGRERSMQPVRQALGVAHETSGAVVFADADQHALARRPGPRDRARLHLREQLLVDPLGGAAQSKLAQRRQIGGREEVLQRALGLLGNVNLSFLEALDQVVRREIHELDRIGAVEHLVRHGLAHAHAGDLRDDVVQALDVLDVDRGVDVDAAVEQLFDIEIAFRVAAAQRVGVSKFIDKGELGAARNDRVEVHLVERLPAVIDVLARDDFKAVEQRLGLLAAMRLDHPDDDIRAVLLFGARALQHLVGLADAGRSADENLQPADAFLLPARCFEQGFRRRSLIVVTLIRHSAIQGLVDRARDVKALRDPGPGSVPARSRAARREYRARAARHARRPVGARDLRAGSAPLQPAGLGIAPPPA